MVERKYDHLFKFILVGDQAVGKTCIVRKIVSNEFSEEYEATVGVDFSVKYVSFNDKNIKCQLWDSAGNEKFRSIVAAYFRGASGILAVYDITKRKSFEYVKEQLNCFKKHLIVDSIVIMIGNKTDLEEAREVSRVEADDYARSNGFVFVEASAKYGELVNEILLELVNEIMYRMGERAIPKLLRNSLCTINLTKEKNLITSSSLPRISSAHRANHLIDMKSNSLLVGNGFISKNTEVEQKKVMADLIDQIRMLRGECEKKDRLISELNSVKYDLVNKFDHF